MRPEVDEERKVREKTEERSQQKGTEETSRHGRSVKRRESGREETSQQKSERRLLEPVNSVRVDQRERISQHS